MEEEIKKLIKKAVFETRKKKKSSPFNIPEIEIIHPKEEKFGDYSTNVAMVLAGK